ncbi:efflux RND transporter periplasmic adaptor subunit [Syntrophomonas erecta subsp. sporosyntropha]
MRRSKRILSILVVLLISSLIVGGCGKKEPVAEEAELTVKVAQAENRPIAKSSTYTGTVRGVNEAQVTAQIPGRVTQIYVKPGEWVQSGQLLVTLDSKSLDTALKQAQASLAGAKAQEAAQRLQLENARINYERMVQLHERGAISDSQLEVAKLQYDTLNSGVIEASVAAGEAAVAALQQQIDNCNLTAPISGVVGAINFALGDTVSPQVPVAIIGDTAQLEIEIQVSESEINYVNTGSQVDVLVAAVSKKPFKGTVNSVSPVADAQKKNYTVKVTLDNPDNIIKSGMFAEISLATEGVNNAICVPRNAVVPKGGRQVVYTVDKKKRAREIEVKIGIENNHYIQITEGLKAGTPVITKGNTLVNDGTLVRVAAGGDK